MSMLVRSQLLGSLRASVKELDRKIVRTDRDDILNHLAAERDAIIAKIEATEEEDDLLWDLVCAVNDAYDGEPLTQDSLAAQLKNHGLVISRKEAKP